MYPQVLIQLKSKETYDDPYKSPPSRGTYSYAIFLLLYRPRKALVLDVLVSALVGTSLDDFES